MNVEELILGLFIAAGLGSLIGLALVAIVLYVCD
jgi:hypothetical protein